MTAYERAIKQGRWLIARRGWLPVVMTAGCAAAVMTATPLRIVCSQWLTLAAGVLAAAGIALHALSAAPAANFAAQGGEGSPPLSEYVAAGGIYSTMRFPSFTADLLLVASMALYTGVGWFAIAAMLAAAKCTGWVLLAREHSLQSRYGEEFTQWCRTTRALTPRLWNWSAWNIPVNPFRLLASQSRKMALVAAIFALVETLKHLRVDFQFHPCSFWLAVLLAAAAAIPFRRK